MNFLEFGGLVLKKADERGYISENDLLLLSLDCGFSTSYFNSQVSCLRKFEIIGKLLKLDNEKVYFFNRDKFKLIKKRYIEGKKKAVK